MPPVVNDCPGVNLRDPATRVLHDWVSLPLNPYIVLGVTMQLLGSAYWPIPNT
ncbi:hypothetical protein C8T65DRAFT_570120 [Cerioporus squamosus]|nr:hypothetical protein C8T65DRAFT_570120 [Cerioporus squamosus]